MIGTTGAQIAIGAVGGGITAAVAVAVFGFAAAIVAWAAFGAGVYAVSAIGKRRAS